MTEDRSPPNAAQPGGYVPGESVIVVDGTFKGMQGVVENSHERARYGLVVVTLPLFGRPTAVELEPWQIRRA